MVRLIWGGLVKAGDWIKTFGSVKEGGPWFEQGGRGHLRRGIITHTLSGVEQGSQKTYISHKRHHPNTKIFLANLAWHPGVATQRGMAALFMWFCWSILSRSPEFTNVPLTDIISHCILQTPPSPIQPQSQYSTIKSQNILWINLLSIKSHQGSLCRYPCIWFQGLYSQARMSSCGGWLWFWAPFGSSTWMYSPGRTGNGYRLSSEVGYG